MTTTLRQLKTAATRLGCTVTTDRAGGTHECRVTAPAGHRFSENLHELVDCAYLPWAPDYDDMLSRLKAYGVEPCDDPDCDWCRE